MEETKQTINEESEKGKKYNWLNQGGIFLIIIVIGVGLFYWYQIRPSKIYSKCEVEAVKQAKDSLETKVKAGATEYSKAAEKGMFLKNDYNYAYKGCLRKYGIYK